jgi:hypothetical protein
MLAIWREMVRAAYLKPFGYVVSDYKVNVDWPSMILFFATCCSTAPEKSQVDTKRPVSSLG